MLKFNKYNSNGDWSTFWIYSECPENKTLKSACTLTIAILIFPHVPFWLLRDWHQADSVVLLTKHFGPQSICFSSVESRNSVCLTPVLLASKSNRGLGTGAAGLCCCCRNCCTSPGSANNLQRQWRHHVLIQIDVPFLMFLRSQFIMMRVGRGVWSGEINSDLPTDKPQAIQLGQNIAKYGNFLTAPTVWGFEICLHRIS